MVANRHRKPALPSESSKSAHHQANVKAIPNFTASYWAKNFWGYFRMEHKHNTIWQYSYSPCLVPLPYLGFPTKCTLFEINIYQTLSLYSIRFKNCNNSLEYSIKTPQTRVSVMSSQLVCTGTTALHDIITRQLHLAPPNCQTDHSSHTAIAWIAQIATKKILMPSRLYLWAGLAVSNSSPPRCLVSR